MSPWLGQEQLGGTGGQQTMSSWDCSALEGQSSCRARDLLQPGGSSRGLTPTADPETDFGASCQMCLGAGEGMWGAEHAWMLCAQCLLVQVHKQGLCCSLGSQSSSGHTPRNFNSLLNIQSATCRRAASKGPLPQISWFPCKEEAQMCRPVQAPPQALQLWCGDAIPAKIRTARQGQELYRRDEMM